MVPHVVVSKCTGCGTCVKECPEQIIGLVKNKAAILTDLCVECGICAFVCPFVAMVNEVPMADTKPAIFCTSREGDF